MADAADDIPSAKYGGLTPREWRTKYGASTNKQKAAGIQRMFDQAKALRDHKDISGLGFGAPIAAIGDIFKDYASRNTQDDAQKQLNALLGNEREAAASYDEARLRGLSPVLQQTQDQAAALRAPVADAAPASGEMPSGADAGVVSPSWGMDLTAGNSPSEAAAPDGSALKPEHQRIIASLLGKLNPGNIDDLTGGAIKPY